MVYVSDWGNDQVVVSSETGIFSYKINVSTCVTNPWGLAYSPDGNHHVAGDSSSNYAIFRQDGKLLMARRILYCRDVTVDVTGFAFIVCYVNESNSLIILSPQGQIVHTIRLNHPFGVAIAPDGSVWVAGYSVNKLWKF